MLEQARPLVTGLRQIADSFMELLPALLTAILLLVVGWITARVLLSLIHI